MPLVAALVLRSQADRKCRPLPDARGNVELATVPVEDVLDNGEPQPSAAFFAARGHADAIEAFREPGKVLGCDARPVISHGGNEAGRPAASCRLAPDADLYAPAVPTVLDGVLHEVLEHLHDFVAVTANHRRFRQTVKLDGG